MTDVDSPILEQDHAFVPEFASDWIAKANEVSQNPYAAHVAKRVVFSMIQGFEIGQEHAAMSEAEWIDALHEHFGSAEPTTHQDEMMRKAVTVGINVHFNRAREERTKFIMEAVKAGREVIIKQPATTENE